MPYRNICLAQDTTGTISGAVKDESGALLPGVSVEIRSEETGRIHPQLQAHDGACSDGGSSTGRYCRLAEDNLGSLEVGKYADFAVLDRDYFTIPESEIWKVRPVMTGLNGKIVYDRDKPAGGN